MASVSQENVLMENSGRRTRSGRHSSGTSGVNTAVSPRTTRRTSKRQAQISEQEEDLEEQLQQQSVQQENIAVEADILSAMMSEAAQGIINDQQELHYDEAQIQGPMEDDIEMLVAAEAGVDEKSSSFPFSSTVIEASETSDEAKDIGVESSLLASLVGDNANSLPSVAGNDELIENKKAHFETHIVHEQDMLCEKLESSDDSISENAIAEDLEIDNSNATIVNTEIISEDELPLPTKPEINDAEEVSDEELPAPKRAELPADAEFISEDELPNASDATIASGRNKRKIDIKIKSQLETGLNVKNKADEQYNPMSPTTESNDESPPVVKKLKTEEADTKSEEKKDKDRERDSDKDKNRESNKDKERKKLPDLEKYWRAVKEDSADFTGWTYLLQYVDGESDAEAAREAYDTFLAQYPYCYGYWRKYADYEKRKGIKANCYAVFERGLQAIPLSVDLWIHYLSHIKSQHPDEEDYIRKQFDRAIDACGLEFRSDKLWDAYIRWETEAKRYQHAVKIYDRLLAVPTQAYNGHFNNFQDLINQHSITSTISKEELVKIRKELLKRSSSRATPTSKSSSTSSSSKSRRSSKEKERDEKSKDTADAADGKSPKISSEPNDSDAASTTDLNESGGDSDAAKANKTDLGDISTLSEEDIAAIKDKVISARRKVHKLTVAAVTARWAFEEAIKRPYFHVKPLERAQLKNWKDYLDFEIEKGDRNRVLVLFERCLIACALYDEFWLKMIRYLETINDEPNVPALTREVFRRACQIHHPDKPSLHLMWAAFEECQSNFDGAAEVLSTIENKCPNLLQIAYRRINIERRRGDFDKCRALYEHYIETAKNKAIAGSLSIKYARFLNKICNDIEAGLKALYDALERDPNNTRVALQMIDLALQRPVVNEQEIVQIMDKFMERENMDPDQKVLFAQRKVEFLEDFGSTAKGLQDAQRALQLSLSKANEAKKKRSETSPSRKSANGKDCPSPNSSTAQASYNNGSATPSANYNYNATNSTSAYYGQQPGASGSGYQQAQQSYDSYYNQWQYGTSSSGYNYSQWSGYGNYY